MGNDDLIIRSGNLNCRVHVNPELEVLLVEKGEVEVKNETGTHVVKAGEAFLIFPYHLHGFSCEGEYIGKVYMFSYSVAEEFYSLHPMHTEKNPKFCVKKPFYDFVKYVTDSLSKKQDLCMVKSLFYAFASEFLENNEPRIRKNKNGLSIQAVVEYIFFHISEELTVQKVADAFWINKNTMSSLFQDALGISFCDFVNNVRIERAKSLLSKKDMTVTQIACECGFGCVRTFNRVFLKNTGCTPSEYKKRII